MCVCVVTETEGQRDIDREIYIYNSDIIREYVTVSHEGNQIVYGFSL